MNEKTKVFVIMPFTDEFFEVYEMLKKRFENDFEFNNAGDKKNQQNILQDIIKPIYDAKIVLADLTGVNPNVMYELGVAHTFNKKTIVITQDDLNDLPFDLKQYRAKKYSTHFKDFEELIEYLRNNINGAIDGTIEYSNPVNDFLQKSNLNLKRTLIENIVEDNVEGEKGFIDFLSEIEESADELTTEISSIAFEMEEMEKSVSKSIEEIDRVNNVGGSGTATFIKKEAKKVAKAISNFSNGLDNHNVSIDEIWKKIENSTLGLLENKFALVESNREGVIDYLKSMVSMKEQIEESNNSVKLLQKSMKNNKGIERSMNQSIDNVEGNLKKYLSVTENICASIDVILEKSEIFIGDISSMVD